MYKTFELMFENGGALTMSLFYGQERAYVHSYDDMEQAAADLNDFLSLEYSVRLWEGNMLEDEAFDPESVELDIWAERSGLAYWATEIDEIKKSVQFNSWPNIRLFIEAWEDLTGND